MARVTVEDCLREVNNRFALVHLGTQRVRQFRQGAKSQITRKNKEIVLALREIAASTVQFDEPPAIVRPASPAPGALAPPQNGYGEDPDED